MTLLNFLKKMIKKRDRCQTSGDALRIVCHWNHHIWNQADLSVIDRLAHDRYFNHGDQTGKEGFKRMVEGVRGVFSDLVFTAQDQLAQGDKVVIRWTLAGTHTGVFMGVPPTGKPVTIEGISIYRLANGKIVEDWSASDMLTLLRQVVNTIYRSDGHRGFLPLI